MSTASSTGPPARPRAKDRLGVKITLAVVVMALFLAAFFAAAGRLDWIAGWVYMVLLTGGQTASALYVRWKNPGLLSRRGRIGPGTKAWDKVWLGFFGVAVLAIWIVAALDAGRYQWSTMQLWLWPAGAALYVLGLAVLTWAMAVNPFFEKTVRIQTDCGHRVIDSGPYRLVRHPGYVGTILSFMLATPLLLGSWWAMVPALASVACLVVRTALEDRTLGRELPGYADYARRVRYRLLPGVW